MDAFGSGTATVTRIHQLCAPTNKNDEDPSAVTSPVHLSGLPPKRVSGTFARPSGLAVVTQFGTYTVNVRQPVLLLDPTSKSLTSPPPPPLGPGTPVRLCHKLVHVTGPSATVHVVDQFTAPGGINPSLGAHGPDTLCVPVDKNGEDPSAPSNPDALMCFTTRNDRLPFGEKTVFITNQFGSFTKVITQYDDLCVPATVH